MTSQPSPSPAADPGGHGRRPRRPLRLLLRLSTTVVVTAAVSFAAAYWLGARIPPALAAVVGALVAMVWELA